MVWNLPNTLTAMRIVLIPFFVAFSYLPGRLGYILSALFFSLAAITDWADGYIARKQQLLTQFGRFFDPVADKLLVISALVLLVDSQRAPFLPVLIILAREVTVMALRERLAGLGQRLPVSPSGKWKTGFQMTAIIMLLVQEALWDVPFQYPGLLCLYISAALTIVSGYRYFRESWPKLQTGN
ncbi:MAG: CDP-diacylglycerol--glycerol-3-phosphate 3-phosphatidyltransferase [Magnetococcales bacterium]|nr:CDP-diacylglycerol--glycerol-3-phosphate 3-phosphatidyltransferase [Magnetococcales bacterium]MBF0116822.1 CDP-diacylglycerol--glycerol-3-phosphate 3-phosphatidyltransferase [Magnetococcales bacterium]